MRAEKVAAPSPASWLPKRGEKGGYVLSVIVCRLCESMCRWAGTARNMNKKKPKKPAKLPIPLPSHPSSLSLVLALPFLAAAWLCTVYRARSRSLVISPVQLTHTMRCAMAFRSLRTSPFGLHCATFPPAHTHTHTQRVRRYVHSTQEERLSEGRAREIRASEAETTARTTRE